MKTIGTKGSRRNQQKHKKRNHLIQKRNHLVQNDRGAIKQNKRNHLVQNDRGAIEQNQKHEVIWYKMFDAQSKQSNLVKHKNRTIDF